MNDDRAEERGPEREDVHAAPERELRVDHLPLEQRIRFLGELIEAMELGL